MSGRGDESSPLGVGPPDAVLRVAAGVADPFHSTFDSRHAEEVLRSEGFVLTPLSALETRDCEPEAD